MQAKHVPWQNIPGIMNNNVSNKKKNVIWVFLTCSSASQHKTKITSNLFCKTTYSSEQSKRENHVTLRIIIDLHMTGSCIIEIISILKFVII